MKRNKCRNKAWLHKQWVQNRLTQGEIAVMCHVCRATVSRWLKGYDIRDKRIHKRFYGRGSNRYISVQKPNHPFATKMGYVPEHRLVMERYIRRYLRKDEIVHHKNGKRVDNRIRNLELLTTKTHYGGHSPVFFILNSQIAKMRRVINLPKRRMYFS